MIKTEDRQREREREREREKEKDRERDRETLREERAKETVREERARSAATYSMQSGKRSYMAATKCAQAKSRSHSTPRQRPLFDENAQVSKKRSANSTPLADWNSNQQQQQQQIHKSGPLSVEKLGSSGKSMRVSCNNNSAAAASADNHTSMSARSILRSYSNNGSSGRPTMKSADFSSLSFNGEPRRPFR